MANNVEIRMTASDAKKLVGLLGDLIGVVDSREYPYLSHCFYDFQGDSSPFHFMRKLQNSLVRASKKVNEKWAKGLPTNNEFKPKRVWKNANTNI